MGGVCISDNLRKYYRLYFGLSNRKWWWYILFWAVGTILTNGYIIYICIHNMHGTLMKHRLSHHYFRKVIACAWINPKKYSAESFEVQSEIRSPRRKRKLQLSSSFLNVNNDTRQIMKRMDHNYNHHNLQGKLMLMTITWPLMLTYTFSLHFF